MEGRSGVLSPVVAGDAADDASEEATAADAQDAVFVSEGGVSELVM